MNFIIYQNILINLDYLIWAQPEDASRTLIHVAGSEGGEAYQIVIEESFEKFSNRLAGALSDVTKTPPINTSLC
jgi:hypothetical protein